MLKRKCVIKNCSNNASKTKIIFGIPYNFCKDHNIKDLGAL